MKKNLIISAVGDESLHSEWIAQDPQFDLCLLYYGTNPDIAAAYAKEATYFQQCRGMKYHLLADWIDANPSIIEQYTYCWLPDNDVSISTADIHRLFDTAEEYGLQLCQPAMTGYVSHPLTEPKPGSFLRYTSFVEVLAPLMQIDTLMQLKDSFRLNHSGWGYDYLWPYLLGYPRNTIAIIDSIVMRHTKPIGADYSRFPKHPKKEMKEIFSKYKGIKKEAAVYRILPGK